jgi:NAD(P)H dehydrogenase (quinone)
MRYLVTGSTGGMGRYVLKYLTAYVPKSDIVALARNEAKAKDLRDEGFEVRIADYADYGSLKRAFTGVERLLFIASVPGGAVGRQQQHKNVVDAAKQAGVGFIAYTSVANADKSTCILAVDHAYTEKLIIDSGIEYVFLRNNCYFENEKFIFDDALNIGRFVYAAGNGRVGWALRREYSEAAARILANASSKKDVLELSGKPITYAELSAALREASGKDFEVSDVDADQFREILAKDNFPENLINHSVSVHAAIKDGVQDVDSEDFQSVLGRTLTPLNEALKELL